MMSVLQEGLASVCSASALEKAGFRGILMEAVDVFLNMAPGLNLLSWLT